MKYKLPFDTRAYMTGGNNVLDLNKTIDYIFNITEGFRDPEPKVLILWREISIISFAYWALPVERNLSLEEYNEAGERAANILGVDFTERQEVSNQDVIKFQLEIVEKDPFTQGDPQNFMHQEVAEKYSDLKRKAEVFCKLNNHSYCEDCETCRDIECFFQITSTFYEELSILGDAYKKSFKNFEYVQSVFRGKRLTLANEEIDFSEIRKIYKKEFGSDEKFYLLPLGIMIIKIINSNQINKNSSVETTMETGVVFEKKVAEVYEAIGYRVSFTSATGDFGIDLIVESNSGRIGVQCKNHGNNVGVDAVMQAHSGAIYYDCKSSVVISSNGFTKSAYEMASKLNVELLTFSG